MPRPFASMVELDAETRGRLEALVRAGSTPQALAFRCRIILRAAGAGQPLQPGDRRRTRLRPPYRRPVARTLRRPRAWTACKTPLAPAGPGAFPPDERARRRRHRHQQDRRTTTGPPTAGRLDEIAATIVNEAHDQAISRATIWRILDRGRPQAAQERLLAQQPRPRLRRQGQGHLPAVRQRPRLLPAGPAGALLRREDRHADPGPAVPDAAGRARQAGEARVRVHPPGHADDDHHLRGAHGRGGLGPGADAHQPGLPRHMCCAWRRTSGTSKRFDWVVDNLNTHWSLELCEVVARLSGLPFRPRRVEDAGAAAGVPERPEHKHVFHFTPMHGSWLNQVELWFSVLARQFLQAGRLRVAGGVRGAVVGVPGGVQPGAGAPVSVDVHGRAVGAWRRRSARPVGSDEQGRAWFGTRPQLFERLLHPPRPYRRTQEATGGELMKRSSR